MRRWVGSSMCAVVVLAIAAVAVSQRAEGPDADGPRPPSAAPPPRALVHGRADAGFPASRIPWAPSLRAAREEARRTDRLVFVVVAFPPCDCPGYRYVEENVFSTTAAEDLLPLAVPVRIHLTDEKDPEGRAFLAQQGVRWAPRFFALDAAGEVVARHFGPLIPPMSLRGTPLPGHEQGGTSVARVLEVLRGAKEKQQADLARAASWAAFLEERGRTEEALREWRRLAERGAHPAWGERLASLLERIGDAEGAAAAWARLAGDGPEDPRRVGWRVRSLLAGQGLLDPVVRQDTPVPHAEVEEELAALGREAAGSGDATTEARVRLVLALRGRSRGPARAAEAVAWCRENEERISWDAPLRLALAHAAMRSSETPTAVAALESLLREFPESDEAEMARHGLLDRARRGETTPGG